MRCLPGNWHTPGSGCQKTGTAAAWIAPLPPRALYHWCWRAIGRAPAHAARPHDANDRRGEARAWKGCSIRETFTPLPGAAWSTAGGPSNGQRGMLVIRAQRTGGGRVGAKAWATVLPAGRPCPRPCAVRACVCVCVSGWESRSRFVLCEKATYIHIQASGDPLPAARSSSHGSKKREVTVKSSVAPQSRVRTSPSLRIAGCLRPLSGAKEKRSCLQTRPKRAIFARTKGLSLPLVGRRWRPRGYVSCGWFWSEDALRSRRSRRRPPSTRWSAAKAVRWNGQWPLPQRGPLVDLRRARISRGYPVLQTSTERERDISRTTSLVGLGDGVQL